MIAANENFELKEFHWLMVMLQTIDVGIVLLDRNYGIHAWNGFMENHSGIRPENVRNKNLFELFPEVDAAWFKHKAEPVFLLQNRAFSTWQQRPYLFRFKNYRPITCVEEHMYQNFTIIPLTSLNGTVDFISLVIYDVTDAVLSKKELERANISLAQQSQTDELTQLNNRRHWEECLIKEFERCKRYGNDSSLLMFDIDHFKLVNDTFGHPAGDEVLRRIAGMLADSTRTTDIAGRYGGEEFCVVLTNTGSAKALVFAERLRKKIESEKIQHQEFELSITISVGVAGFNAQTSDYKTLIANADRALYKSKEQGRNRISVHE